jgi:AcrR family transcriptional regulator
MSKRWVIKSDIQFLLFGEIYGHKASPGGKRKALALVEAAIQCYSRRGFDRTTLTAIAREAGVTRPLLLHYFSDQDEIREYAAKYIRVILQRIAVDAISRESSPARMLEQYVNATFVWADTFRTHAVAWLSFLQCCTRDRHLRRVNNAAIQASTARLELLLEKGLNTGEFRFSSVTDKAEALHALIGGALISYVSQDLEDPKGYIANIRREALQSVLREC